METNKVASAIGLLGGGGLGCGRLLPTLTNSVIIRLFERVTKDACFDASSIKEGAQLGFNPIGGRPVRSFGDGVGEGGLLCGIDFVRRLLSSHFPLESRRRSARVGRVDRGMRLKR